MTTSSRNYRRGIGDRPDQTARGLGPANEAAETGRSTQPASIEDDHEPAAQVSLRQLLDGIRQLGDTSALEAQRQQTAVYVGEQPLGFGSHVPGIGAKFGVPQYISQFTLGGYLVVLGLGQPVRGRSTDRCVRAASYLVGRADRLRARQHSCRVGALDGGAALVAFFALPESLPATDRLPIRLGSALVAYGRILNVGKFLLP